MLEPVLQSVDVALEPEGSLVVRGGEYGLRALVVALDAGFDR